MSFNGDDAFICESTDDAIDVGEEAESERLRRESGGRDDRLVRDDLIELASDLSVGGSPFESMVEDRGLSFFELPGILDRSERNDRVESLVSERLKEGYDCRPSGADDFDDAAPLSLEP